MSSARYVTPGLFAILVITSILPMPVEAAPRIPAVPATVRVNVTPFGVNYTLITSTGNITAKRADGRLVYAGPQRLVARTFVRDATARVPSADNATLRNAPGSEAWPATLPCRSYHVS